MRLMTSMFPSLVPCFNPRIPCGMRPSVKGAYVIPNRVSIHASRVGCDQSTNASNKTLNQFQSTHPVWDATERIWNGKSYVESFNPRIPCGMRPGPFDGGGPCARFQSTHPVWDATTAFTPPTWATPVSIHASRVGCDPQECIDGRLPPVSIHASRVGCDGWGLMP